MATILLIFELFITLALIGIVLIQRSEGGGLGIGGSQGMGSFMGGRGTANLLTRTTAILATAFMGIALVLALLGRGGNPTSILNAPPPASHSAAAPARPPLHIPPPLPGAPPRAPSLAPLPTLPTQPPPPPVPTGPSVPTK
ncbi:MAG: preprotein translocase subunit SecG [Acetobacteraceae bacterium]